MSGGDKRSRHLNVINVPNLSALHSERNILIDFHHEWTNEGLGTLATLTVIKKLIAILVNYL